MLLFTLAIILGLVLLIWSADRFIEGAASTANHLGMPPLAHRYLSRRLWYKCS